MTARFHVPGARASGEVVALPDEEATHLTRVLRLRPGDAVRVFNGFGQEFDAVVAAVGKSGATVCVGDARTPAPEVRIAMALAQAVLKGDKMDDVVRDAVMLGVEVVQPLVTERTAVTRTSLARGRKQDRWQRIAVSSAKQCGRATVPRVCEPLDFDAWVDALATDAPSTLVLMFVEPRVDVQATRLSGLGLPTPRCVTVAVGPEGGWTDTEIARGRAVARLVTLGERTLRADAAPLVALSALLTTWGEF